MSLPGASQQELYDAFKLIIQTHAPELTDFLDGSQLDTLAGAFSVAGDEMIESIIVDQFRKTFFDLADGPDENDGGPDDLQTLAVDHFGSAFARPLAVAAVDTCTFSRATNTAGAVTILAGTVVKTVPDANGAVQRYTTDSDATLLNLGSGAGLSVSVPVTAVVAGAAGSAAAGTIKVVETSLADATIVVTNTGNATGEDAPDSSTYREFIRNLIVMISKATRAAIEAAAKTVPGVKTATSVETAQTVIGYVVASSSTIGNYFRITSAALYVADSTGTASLALLNKVRDAIATIRACGIAIEVRAATAITMNWTASFTLNPSGPSYASFSVDPQKILDSMTDYINALPVGTSFVRATANAAILAIWGPSGTNDITAFSSSVPSGDVTATAVQKFVAGTVAKV